MKRLHAATVLLIVAVLMWAPPASAAADNGGSGARAAGKQQGPDVVVGWTSFSWFGSQPAGPFGFAAATASVLTVTDAYCAGDVFAVIDGGVDIGRTSSVAPDPSCSSPAIGDPDLALAEPAYSHGAFPLRPGAHFITFVAVQNPFGSGSAFFRVDTMTKQDCKKGAYVRLGFRNQGQCIAFL